MLPLEIYHEVATRSKSYRDFKNMIIANPRYHHYLKKRPALFKSIEYNFGRHPLTIEVLDPGCFKITYMDQWMYIKDEHIISTQYPKCTSRTTSDRFPGTDIRKINNYEFRADLSTGLKCEECSRISFITRISFNITFFKILMRTLEFPTIWTKIVFENISRGDIRVIR